MDISVDTRGVARLRVLALLNLAKKTASGDNAIAVKRFWQDESRVTKAGDACASPAGLATRIYEALVSKCGVTLVSDNK